MVAMKSGVVLRVMLLSISGNIVHGFLADQSNKLSLSLLQPKPRRICHRSSAERTASSETSSTYPLVDGTVSASTVYFDIQVTGKDLGRLIFDLANPSPLPIHTENIIQLMKGSRRGIDPKAHYIGCEFDYSPASVEDGMGRYRWGHQLLGRGRNAIGRSDQAIVDVVNQRQNTHSCFGGQYYGISYHGAENDEDPGVLLTVPVMGPGHGSSKFSIIRVGESPKEWRDRLLINSGVVGRLRSHCLPVLHAMARQRMGPPTIAAAGVLNDAD